MKTDNDLLMDFMRWQFSSICDDEVQVDLLMQEAERRWSPRMRAPNPLTDEEYATQLEAMKKEDPAYRQHLMGQPDLPVLPDDQKPFPGPIGSN